MAQYESWFKQDLKKPINVQLLNGNLFSQDNQGNLIGVEVFDNGEPASLTGTVSANIIRADGGTVAATGTLSGNKCSVVLPAAAYAIPGLETIVIKLTSSGVVTTLLALVVTIYRASTDTAVDPGTVMPSIQTLIQQINTAVASIPADYSSLWTSLAPAFSTDTSYAAGQYVTNNGKVYRFNAAHSGEWAAGDVSEVKVGNELTDLKSAFSESGNDLLDNRIFTITHNGSSFNAGVSGVIDITAPTAVEGWNSYVISCSAQDEFVVWAVGGLTTYAWAFIDASGNVLARSAGNATVNGLKITAPENTQYLVVCDKGGNSRVYKGELYKNRIQAEIADVYNAIKTNSKNCLFYVGNGTKVSWSGYNESPITLSLGTNDYIIIIDNTTYTILLNDIISAATSAGITVDQSNNTLTDTSFLLYFDVATHTPKAINSMSSSAARTAISNNPVLFAAHFKSFRGGLLVDYMQEHHVEDAQNNIELLNVEIEAIKAVSDDFIPTYFESNLSAKIPEIISNMNDAGQNGTTFVFITDLHWETNYKNSPALVKRVLDKTSVKNVFCGGDIINQGEKAEMSEVFLDCINRFRFVPNLGFFPIARGNHDDNSNWSSDADIAAYSFDENTVYNLYYSQFADKVTRIGMNWAFYFDQEVIKTRYIFVDTKRNGLIIDVDAIINCLSSVENGWHVIILMHFTLRNATTLFDGCDLLAHIVNSYNRKENGSYTGSYQTATYDFTNAVGKVDLIIGGHMHADYAMNADDTNNPSGVPIIATDTDSYRNSASIEGTADSQCFDVVTVNYSAKTVKCVRIGRGIDRDFAY